MTFHPVLPPLLLAAVAAIIVAARIVALRRLPPRSRTRGVTWRWAGMTLATLLLVVTATRPVLNPDRYADTRVADPKATNVFLVVDRSPDMRLGDQPGGASRMAVARDDVAALLDRYPGARVAVISFASRAALDWPLSADTWSLRPVASTLEPYPTAPDAVTEANAGAAGNTLRYQLIGAVQQYPRATNLVFYLGAGTPAAAQPPRDFNLPDGAVDGGAVIGYGRVEGAADATLRSVADQIGVPYVARDDVDGLASVLPAAPANPASGAAPAARGTTATELYWAPALLASMLVLVELSLALREFRRTRLTGADVTV